MATTNVTHVTDDNQKPFDDVESVGSVTDTSSTSSTSTDSTDFVVDGEALTEQQRQTLLHWKYNPDTNRLEGDRPVQTTLSSLYLDKQHGVHSGGRTYSLKTKQQE